MGPRTKSVSKTQSPSNTYSFSSSGYSSQSLSEFDNHNRTSLNYTVNNNSTSNTTSDYRVRTSTPTIDSYNNSSNHEISILQRQQQEPAIYIINQKHTRIIKTKQSDDLDCSNNPNNTSVVFQSVVNFFIKCLSCFNIFNIFPKKGKRDSSKRNSGSPTNSIYDNYNDDIQRYYQQEPRVMMNNTQQNYYEYKPAVLNYEKGLAENRYIRPQMVNTKQQATIPISTPVTAHITSMPVQYMNSQHSYFNAHQKAPIPTVAIPIHHQQSYYNDHTRNSTFIHGNTLNEAAIVMKPYLSSSSISSIESSMNNKRRSYSVESVSNIKNNRNQRYVPRYQQQQRKPQSTKYPKSYSTDSVIASSISTSVSSLATATSCSSLTPSKTHVPALCQNLQFISPIVNTSEFQKQYRPKDASSNYDTAPKVMIQLEKISLNKRHQQRQQQRQQNKQFPLLNPIYDDYLCDKEVEGYFENPVYFDCYAEENNNNNYVFINSQKSEVKSKNLLNNAINSNYYVRCNQFKSESYC